MGEKFNQEDLRFVKADKNAAGDLKSLLLHVYEDEPTFRYLFNADKPAYSQRVRATIREAVHSYFDDDHTVMCLYHKHQLIGCVFIGTSDEELNVTHNPIWYAKMVLTAGFDATDRYIKYQQTLVTSMPVHPCIVLPLMGVHPKFREHGCGQYLMEATLEYCQKYYDKPGIGVEVANPEYVKFCESFGFQLMNQLNLGETTTTVLYKAFN